MHQSILEVGGAPGQYVASLAAHVGGGVAVLDSSPVGCELARQNFALLGMAGEVIEKDLFSGRENHAPFDVVFSLGLIEHFPHLDRTIQAHLEWLRVGGLLVVGCPNFRGVYKWPLLWLRPGMMATNDRATMHLAHWDEFEKTRPVDRVFRGYIGGFEPGLLAATERQSASARIVAKGFRALTHLLRPSRTHPLARFNSALWSGYIVGVYRKKAAQPGRTES